MHYFSSYLSVIDENMQNVTALEVTQFNFLFVITAAGAVPCGGRKKSPRTSSIVQSIYSFWSFEISEDILRNQNLMLSLDTCTFI